MEKFIRLDFDKGFRGKDHRSSFTGDGEHFEKGISCYRIDKNNIVNAIEQLAQYWCETAGECDFSNYDINIFEGYHLDEYGADGEDLAECTGKITTLDGCLFNKVEASYWKLQTYLDYKDDEEMLEGEEYLTTEEWRNKIIELFEKYI